MKIFSTVLLGTILALGLAGAAAAQEDVVIPDLPSINGGFARFFPVARNVTVPPGGRTVQILNVFNMEKVAVQAVGHSTPGEGAVRIQVGFGPPHVPVPADHLNLIFPEQDTARASEIFPIRGPRMAVVIVNDRSVPVILSVGVYATN